MNDTSLSARPRVLLLVEDNAGDAALVRELLADAWRENYQIVHVPRLDSALVTLHASAVDVIVLDLRLPDCIGVETVQRVRASAGDVPIVVLTGTDDEKLALACIDAGAQDYLSKSELRPHNLKRAIGYAVSRMREAQLHQMTELLQRYRALSSASQGTTVTAALAGSGAIAVRNPAAFEMLVREYFGLLEPYLARQQDRVEAPREDMERIVTAIGDVAGGPRDLLDVHVAALDRALATYDDPHSKTIVFEARLLALQMMGLLVDYYRVGQRRRSFKGAPS